MCMLLSVLLHGTFILYSMANLLSMPWKIVLMQYGNFTFTYRGLFFILSWKFLSVFIFIHIYEILNMVNFSVIYR